MMCAASERARDHADGEHARRPAGRSSTGWPSSTPRSAARGCMMLHAAWMIDRHGAEAARDEISAIKFYVANTMLQGGRHARSRCTARSASPTTPSSRTGTDTSAPPASTTAPTRSTRPPSAGASCAATHRAAPMFPSPRVAAQLVGDGCRAVIGDGEGGERAPGEPRHVPPRRGRAPPWRSHRQARGLGHDGHRHETGRGLARARVDDVVAALVAPRRCDPDVGPGGPRRHLSRSHGCWIPTRHRVIGSRAVPAAATSPPALIAEAARSRGQQHVAARSTAHPFTSPEGSSGPSPRDGSTRGSAPT